MKQAAATASVRTEIELRVSFPSNPGRLGRILRVLRKSAGALQAHLVYRLQDRTEGLFLCEKPADGAQALRSEGEKVETETVVTVRSPNRPGTFSYLVETLEAEKVEVGYAFSTAMEKELLVVLRTADNPKAEDVLRNLLILPDPSIPSGLESGGGGPARRGGKPRPQPTKRSS